MLSPMYELGESIRSRFDFSNDVSRAAEKFSNDVNDYVSRTVAADSFPPAAVLALGALGKLHF